MKNKYGISPSTRIERTVFWSVFILMFFAFIWSIVNAIEAPLEYNQGVELIKNDYILMATESFGGMFVLLLPTFIEKKWHFDIPSTMHIFVIIFLFAAIILGEFRRFHFIVPHFDKMLHILSGAFLAALSFTIIQVLYDHDIIKINPMFVAIFAFCFAMTMGVFWELYEFAWDSTMNLNMMKYMDETGTSYVGLNALNDTMWDFIIDGIGAFTMSLIGYISIKHDKIWINNLIIRKAKKEEE